MEIQKLQIDGEFRSKLRPLSKEEKEGLATLIDKHGWTEPLFYWEGHGILIDGHHRYDIWHRDYRGKNLPQPEVKPLYFETRDEVIQWIQDHNDFRRHEDPKERDKRIRKKYSERKKPRGRPKKTTENTDSKNVSRDTISGKSSPDAERKSTAEQIADEENVSVATVNRAVAGGKKQDKKEDSSASVVLDAIDREVPEALRESHSTASEIVSAGTKLDQVKRLVKELAEKPGGEFLEVQAIEIALKEAKRLITQSRYWSECPRCKGKVGKTCSKCDKAGFLPWSLKQQLSEADRKYLGIPDF